MNTKLTKLSCVLLLLALLDGAAWAGETERAGEAGPAKAKPLPTKIAPADLAAVVKSNNDFTWAIYDQLAKAKGNLFFSPSSIHTALAMTYAGARGNTATEMHYVLVLPAELEKATALTMPARDGHMHTIMADAWPQERVHKTYAGLLGKLKPGPKASYKLHVANALWGQQGYPWLEEFLATTSDNYGAGLREVDFKTATEPARLTINKWVEEQTNEKIKDLLPQGTVKPTTRLVLTNAIYFKGDWADQFDKKLTTDAPFKLSAGKSVQVPLMHRKGDYGYAETKKAKMLRLPYAGKDLSMLVFLPKRGFDLGPLVKVLAKADLDKAVKGLRTQEVDVFIPRFKMTSKFSLAETLTKMGMVDAFSDKAADFSGMNGQKDLFISAVVHKAFVDVNEKGTEAAAATGVVVGITSVPLKPKVFRADRPFVFMIRHDKTGAILFLGRVMNPKA